MDKMPMPPKGAFPKKPRSTVPEKVQNNTGTPHNERNLNINIKRLENLERMGFIKDWDYIDGEGGGYKYYITLLNDIEIKLKGGNIPTFYLGAMSAACFYDDTTKLLSEREIHLYVHDNKDD